MTEHVVAHDGLRFRCRIDGPPGAPWMVFSNSLVTDLSVWDPQVAAFGDRYRILRYDQRGHGGTDVPSGRTSITQLSDDAAALMAHFGVTGAVFAGVSMGAATGFCLAPRMPAQIARLVASDGQAATAPGGAQLWQDRIDAARRDGAEALADATVARWFSPSSKARANPAMAKVRAMVANTKLDGFIVCAQALQDYDVRATLPAITQPSLLIAGAADGAMPQTMRGLARILPNARYVEIADAGHIPGIECPDDFNAALEAFLR